MSMRSVYVTAVVSLMIAGAVPAGAQEAAHDDPPHVVMNDWHGFMACGVGTPALAWNTCAGTGFDENHHTVNDFTVAESLYTLVVGMEWDSGTLGADSLQIHLADAQSGDVIAEASGSSPLEFRIDAGEDFDPLSGPWDLQFAVFPPFEPAVIYQQPFQVYYHEFHGVYAPAGYTALPDN